MESPEPKNIIFASCDKKYFLEHAEAFVTSAFAQGEIAYVHCQDGYDENVLALGNDLSKRFPDFRVFHMDYRDRFPKAQPRSVFAVGRFLFAKQVLQNNLLILDIDSFIRKPIEWEDFRKMDYSIFFRDPLPGTVGWEREGTRVAAGAVYVSRRSKLMDRMTEILKLYPELPWFVDQIALFHAHEALEKDEHFCQMPKKYIDWNFTEDSTVWTGKGQRKHSKEYLNGKSTYIST
jgi:hypothetical protein